MTKLVRSIFDVRSGHKTALLLMTCLLLVGVRSHAQERYAILVGAGYYYHLDKRNQLKGPSNDVRLARDYLLHVEEFEEDNIFWLSDDPDAPGWPRRAPILEALRSVDEKVRDNDFVMLHFSGHGSRQPAGAGATEELDGLDEIFLPGDAKGWNDDIGSVENAITDNELGEFISSYQRKGADVWFIIDSCHSGTMTKGLGDEEVRTRTVKGSDLGIPEPVPDGSLASAIEPARGPAAPPLVDDYSSDFSERGMLITFAAAHTSQRAPEMRLPKRDPQGEVRGAS